MPKQGEIEYLRHIGVDGVKHAMRKPFSDPACGSYLLDIGMVFHFLPPPPAKLLDLGCGTGWTSCFFAQRGYDVTGQDIAPDMIDCANENKQRASLDNLRFVVSDYESLDFDAQFDCAVFFDALHHAEDERSALRAVWQALRPGGVCVAVEPGRGHEAHWSTQETIQKFGVTEKDMHPGKVLRLAREVGFGHGQAFPRISEVGSLLLKMPSGSAVGSLLPTWWLRGLATLHLLCFRRGGKGISVLVK